MDPHDEEVTTLARQFARSSYNYTGSEVNLWVCNLCDIIDALRAEVKKAAAERAALTAVVREHPNDDHDGNAPGHSHLIPGVWDSDNGKKAGKPCHWCATWNRAKTLVEAPREDTR
jgi:hypothetical protein